MTKTDVRSLEKLARDLAVLRAFEKIG